MGFWLKQNPGVYVDCTTGGGGHSAALLEQLEPGSTLHCLDRDADALAHAGDILKSDQVEVQFHHRPFAELAQCVPPATANGILYDLGVSSHQLDEKSRGFTWTTSAQVLDMRMDKREEQSAQEWMLHTDPDDMAHALRANSDLDRAHQLARKIKEVVAEAIAEGPITAATLRSAVESVYRDRRFDLNSLMARVMQAIRMEINSEMPQIEESLKAAVACLVPGGRLCVISYHSVEDRKVKQTMAVFETACFCSPKSPICNCGGNHRKVVRVLRKPQLPTEDEIRRNPRARSAKLRVYERT